MSHKLDQMTQYVKRPKSIKALDDQTIKQLKQCKLSGQDYWPDESTYWAKADEYKFVPPI